MGTAPVKVLEGESWDAMAHAYVALAASGTVTVEAAMLGTPMVTFYKVTAPSWLLGKLLVDVPFYSMVNFIAGRAVVPELMQGQMTGDAIAARSAPAIDGFRRARAKCNAGLAEVRQKLSGKAMRPAAQPPSFKRFWKDKPHMFRNLRTGGAVPARPIADALPSSPRCAAQQAERRNRIDVQDYVIEAEISPNTQT